jgi:hypothetical protein
MTEKPLICCVKAGSLYGPEYVTNLRDGIARHCPVPHEFVCLTDAPVDGVECQPLTIPLPGWWSKLNLYALRRPLIYFDLDMVICGDLQRLLDWEGFGTLENSWADIMGHPVGYNTSVLKLTGNEGFVWEKFHPGILALRGDQDWLNVVYPGQPTFPRAWFPSYKIDKLYKHDAPPHGAMACNFHGQPKPHEFTEAHGWVKDYWTGNIPAHAA